MSLVILALFLVFLRWYIRRQSRQATLQALDKLLDGGFLIQWQAVHRAVKELQRKVLKLESAPAYATESQLRVLRGKLQQLESRLEVVFNLVKKSYLQPVSSDSKRP
jgi:hypothetical protein